MKIRHEIIEIEADAKELRESNPLASNFISALNRAFQSREPLDDEDDATEDGDADVSV